MPKAEVKTQDGINEVKQWNQVNWKKVDGLKSLTQKQRIELVGRLKLTGKASPTRRVWIPKPGTKEKRPLGIPVIYDRALQALTKLALEPEWEALFEPNSWGFRPGRSCHDAIGAIFNAIKQKSKFVLDADISKCFDNINHQVLLRKINTFLTMSKQIKAWLKSGVLDKGIFESTDRGAPQGSVISPLLANIALHGMENRIKQYATTLKGNKGKNKKAVCVVRYADDFTILHENLEVILKCQQIIQEWLSEIGLELKSSKTRIAHTLNELNDEKPGFDFLGFNIRQYPVGKYQTGCNTHGEKLGFKTIIKPSFKKVKEHHTAIVKTIDANKVASQATLISRLNPIIKGWSNYYSRVCSKETFSKLDYLTYQKLRRWANRRHPNKKRKWVVNKYWQTIGEDHWVFATPQKGNNPIILIKHSQTPIVRHIKVKDKASLFNGDLLYWSTRMGTHPEVPIKTAKLLKKQKGKCTHCGLHFKPDDVWEIDHVNPKAKGGRNTFNNLQLLHRHCHHQKTRFGMVGMFDKHPVTEEPCEVNISCTVLKTSQQGDLLA
ncbi:MAG: group II intron reverse transcriptase/maturase [Richelia sp. RM1_1_1]|nr:group II intron reverse transcriptase/maturase [Richelia sp. SM1_7_0]NJN13134.1 group II intron reverse transcriptase/maturase [Richelia sp. RM1_1_1]